MGANSSVFTEEELQAYQVTILKRPEQLTNEVLSNPFGDDWTVVCGQSRLECMIA